MATPNNQNTNTEKFNKMMRRSSDRLRGGSVPPPDSEPVVPSSITTTQRGRGRGRGRRNGMASTRIDNQSSNKTGTTPVVTLTVPGSNNPAPPPLPTPDAQGSGPNSNQSVDQSSSTEDAIHQEKSGTSVLHSAGLLARDKAVNAQNSQSPTRRNTVTGVGESPPKGLHSWLLANGLTVVQSSNKSVPSLHGVTSAITQSLSATVSGQQKSVGNSSSSLPSVTNTVTSSAAPAKKKIWDLTKDSDDATKEISNVPTKKKAEVGEAGIQNHGLVALLKYWDDKMKPVDGYVPLSIFNLVWLRQDLVRVKPKNKNDKDDSCYVGLPVVDEWKMTFGEWVTAFDLFVAYLRYYEHGRLADLFMIHKANVLAIKSERLCWPMAFRYDQAVRTTVMTIRNEDGKLANPAIRDETFERNARMDSERMNDFQPRFGNINPYADFECKSNINPLTGEVIHHNTTQGGTVMNSHLNQVSHHGKPNARSWAFANQNVPCPSNPTSFTSQPVYKGPGSSGYHHYDDRRGGGRNVRGRGRGGAWVNNAGGGREDRYDTQRAEGNGSWRKEDRREDRRGGDREVTGPKYGGGGKAK
ncbi:uncharacterized protein MELLADRAFT_84244 [Melampsora larici-populina 98AG31]|uniref:Uncharacterized protein n=1 Tax=Melampsora larici-populina (strain 98AG31 / pathotype 3-4-7) TaxID=747676 RepID=F4RF10_MELLP|nr:uncharacterized protein MELLADRAFT_84244 [Melampsora larici-populina 98AG31]EGG09022.1 hypothetical protein MELLADRAFT_84244 [Melampsora larici-populina 98AG31]